MYVTGRPGSALSFAVLFKDAVLPSSQPSICHTFTFWVGSIEDEGEHFHFVFYLGIQQVCNRKLSIMFTRNPL